MSAVPLAYSRPLRPVLQTILQQRAFHLPAVQAGRTYKPAGRQFDASLQRLWPAAVYPVFPQILCSRKHQVPFLRLQSSSPFALQTFGIRYAAWECRYGPPVLLSKLDIDKILVSILCPPMSLWEYGRYKIGVQIIQISRCLRQRRYSLLYPIHQFWAITNSNKDSIQKCAKVDLLSLTHTPLSNSAKSSAEVLLFLLYKNKAALCPHRFPGQ